MMAEKEGFEPSIEFPLYTLSRGAPSATRPFLHGRAFYRLSAMSATGFEEQWPFRLIVLRRGGNTVNSQIRALVFLLFGKSNSNE